ncbi:potassium voltage-gated channel subfamily A member 1 [Elysia marginata]|uniref:Potassium voltage-gated channel subfamily A member 1 n=1 Tax=Elysia marginata TaxID=1093978 RepID=A0AAV4GBI3_9GAST|nr:potassium voltage-gated channel subfamily A member 1 [Elysia marginata]
MDTPVSFCLEVVNSQTSVCGAGNSPTGSGLSVLRVLRVVRILKLSKHSEGLKILGKTMKTSIRELSMFILFLGIATVIYAGAIFYLEMGQPRSMFTSIPDAFWWSIVTMTTVGYGDYVPIWDPSGRSRGSPNHSFPSVSIFSYP